MVQRSRLFGALLWVALASLWSPQVAVAGTTSAAAPASSSPVPPNRKALAQLSSHGKEAAIAAREASAKAREKVDAFAKAAAQSKASLKTLRASFKNHLRDGGKAYKGYQAALRKPKATPPTDALPTAHAAYEGAVSDGAKLVEETDTLRATEGKMADEVSGAARALDEAKAAAAECKRASAELATLARHLSATAKKEKTDAATQAAAHATQAAADAKKEAQEAKLAATAAGADALKARTKSGLGAPQGYAARKARIEKEDAKLKEDVAAAQKLLADVDAASKGAT